MKKISIKAFKDIVQGDTPVLVDFYADWCGPCKTLLPILEDVEMHYGEKLKVLRVNVERSEDLSRKYSIFSVPTMMLFNKGKQEWKVAGVRSKNEIIKVVNKTSGIVPEPKPKGEGMISKLMKGMGLKK